MYKEISLFTFLLNKIATIKFPKMVSFLYFLQNNRVENNYKENSKRILGKAE